MSITSFIRLALTFQVRKRVAVIFREHLPDDFLPPPIQTPRLIRGSDKGNLVHRELPRLGGVTLVCLRVSISVRPSFTFYLY